jgi:hypothetical protein
MDQTAASIPKNPLVLSFRRNSERLYNPIGTDVIASRRIAVFIQCPKVRRPERTARCMQLHHFGLFESGERSSSDVKSSRSEVKAKKKRGGGSSSSVLSF